MSGSYNDNSNSFSASVAGKEVGLGPISSGGIIGNPSQYYFDGIDSYIHMITGSAVAPSLSSDDLWERMYVRPKPVIIICGACGSHNAISNPTCVQCGAPMSWGKEKTYE